MKNFINKILDLPKLIRTIWFILWIILIILLVMKFCFGIWYPIIVKNENLIKFNNFICSSWVRYIILVLFYLISGNILYLTSSIKRKYSNILEFIVINSLMIINFIIKCYNRNYAIIIELLISVVIPIITLLKTYKNGNKIFLILFPFAIQLLIFLWQLNIYLVRGIDFDIATDNHILIGIILQLDYYIFLTITWIGVTFMSLFSFWIFSKDITVLKAAKEKELARKTPNLETIEKIDERIAELEKEGK